jgi:hypothetical protein
VHRVLVNVHVQFHFVDVYALAGVLIRVVGGEPHRFYDLLEALIRLVA